MANPGYLRSTDGSDADTGATWALANASMAGAMTDAAAGDRVWISQAHNESAGGAAITVTGKGTLASPMQLLCGNDAAEPPTALATTAVIGNTGGNSITWSGHHYAYGITINCGSGASSATLTLCSSAGDVQRWKSCVFNMAATDVNSHLYVTGLANDRAATLCIMEDCNIKLTNASQSISPHGGTWIWRGGSLVSGSITSTALIRTANSRCAVAAIVEGVDLSAGASTMGLTGVMNAGTRVLFRNCKLPGSWSGALCSTSPPAAGVRVEMHNCDSGDTNYRLWVEDYCGSIKSETTIIRTGGASDGTTGLSWKMASSANAKYPTHLLESPDIVIWNDTTGSSKTVTVEIVHDSAGAGSGSKFQDDEIWLQVQYYGTSGFPLGTHITDCKADVLATAANQADSTETWTTTGLASPVKQALSVTFTPQEKGYFIARVVLAKASKTVYVCPKATVS